VPAFSSHWAGITVWLFLCTEDLCDIEENSYGYNKTNQIMVSLTIECKSDLSKCDHVIMQFISAKHTNLMSRRISRTIFQLLWIKGYNKSIEQESSRENGNAYSVDISSSHRRGQRYFCMELSRGNLIENKINT